MNTKSTREPQRIDGQNNQSICKTSGRGHPSHFSGRPISLHKTNTNFNINMFDRLLIASVIIMVFPTH